MADVRFENFSVQCKNALEETVIAYLYTVAEEITTRTAENSTQGKEYKGIAAEDLWSNIVDESDKVAKVGSPHEAAYWEEFGTGEHALYGNGRKGWWVYVEGSDTPRSHQNQYTQSEAEAVAASMRAAGIPAHATNGSKPKRPLHNTFTQGEADFIRLAEHMFKERLD